MARPKSNTDHALLARLRATSKPMSAYELLALLRADGVQSPPVVYRALDRLVKNGEIHRLEGMNAYFACHGHHKGTSQPVFAVCTHCHQVEEWSIDHLDHSIQQKSVAMGFSVIGASVEIRGTCRKCNGLTTPEAGAACCELHPNEISKPPSKAD